MAEDKQSPLEPALAELSPGSFAFVMATGIVSMASYYEGWERIALGLFYLNVVAYVLFWAFTVARFIWCRKRLLEDLTNPSRGADFLSTAAASCVLGAQFVVLASRPAVAQALWVLGTLLSCALSYGFLTATTFRSPKPSLETDIKGAWLLLVVAPESVAVLGALIARCAHPVLPVLLTSLVCCCVGVLFYVMLMTLILYHWVFAGMRPEQLTPACWIAVSAKAITSLAAALLLEDRAFCSFLEAYVPFLHGVMMFAWAVATWWIPLLVALSVWSRLRRRVRLSYSAEWWDLVFSLGMYAVATSGLARVDGLTSLNTVATIFSYVALIAWAVVFVGVALRWLVLRFMPSRTNFPI